MTRSAARFVGPVTFEAITRRPVITSQWKPGMNADIEHIAIADAIALLLVAPCTANVDRQVRPRHRRRFPELAVSGDAGAGAARPGDEHEHAGARGGTARICRRWRRAACGSSSRARGIWRAAGSAKGAWPSRPISSPRPCGSCRRSSRSLRGRHVLVTAGPTYEDIDPVRYVGNRSSGRMGFALAVGGTAARRARHAGRRTDRGLSRRPLTRSFVSAARPRCTPPSWESRADADVVVMAAAVADYTPADPSADKIAKTDAPLTLTLERTPDILAELGRMPSASATRRPILVGFAAETGDVVARARDEATPEGDRPDRGQRRLAAGRRFRRRRPMR